MEKKIEQIFKLVTLLKIDSDLIIRELRIAPQKVPFKLTDKFYDYTSAAGALCVSKKSVWRWVLSNQVTFIRIGNRPLFEKEVLIQEVKDNKLIKRKRPCKCD